MMNDKEKLTYRSAVTVDEWMRYLKAIGVPLMLFGGSLYVINKFAAFGSAFLAPMIGLMWGVGCFCGIVLPSHRQAILGEISGTLGVYLVTLTALQMILNLLAGIPAESLKTAFDNALSTSGNTAISWVNNMLYITSFMVPFGFIGMQIKRLFEMRRNIGKTKTFARLRSIRDTGRKTQ